VALFAAIRGCSGDGEAAVLIENVDPTSLKSHSFELSRPVRMAVAATGSFEDPGGAGGDTALAAYGWIVRRNEGSVFWRLSAANARRQRGTLAEATDTLDFQPGVYDVYFASYGDPEVRTAAPRPRSLGGRFRRILSRDGRAWVGDAGRWMISVTPVVETDADAISMRGDAPEEMLPGAELLWNGASASPGERQTWMFEVRAPGARVALRAVADAPSGAFAARAALERVGGGGGDTLWSLREAATRWAGGARRNRQADTTIALQRGLYRVSFVDTGRHAWGEWAANPPFIPSSWGLTLAAVDGASASAVSALNPWSSLPRLASFSCVGPSADRRLTFTIRDSLDVQVHALGEVTGSTVHDGARLLRWSGGDPSPVWEMVAEETRHGGGAEKNRIGEATLSLTPGRYTLAYYTDSSHDCTDFNSEAPENPSRWGATLFVLDPDFDLRRVTIEQDGTTGAAGEVAAIASATDTTSTGAGPAGRTLVRLDRLGNDRVVSAALEMPQSGVVRIYAIGEIIPSQRFDYGWITAGDGSVLWEMTRGNTHAAGGSQKNRIFDGTVRLPAGSHTVHFRTDGQHAYGSFQQPPPDDPEGWGIRVERVQG
jgi:hypothetical protein